MGQSDVTCTLTNEIKHLHKTSFKGKKYVNANSGPLLCKMFFFLTKLYTINTKILYAYKEKCCST